MLLFLAFARGRRMILPRGMDREHVGALFSSGWRLTDTHDMLPAVRRQGAAADPQGKAGGLSGG
jgi:hypothetical protein